MKNYPDGEKMRYIPTTSFLQNSGITQKMVDIITRQRWFLAGISAATFNEPSNLDAKSDRLRLSLRGFIMEMKNRDDKSWSRATVSTFPTKYADEAVNRIADLTTYLKVHEDLLVLAKHFTPDAAARAQESEWDPSLGRLRSKMDEFLDSCLDNDDMANWFSPPSVQSVVNTSQTPIQAHKPSLFTHINPNDDQSLDTFNSQPITETVGPSQNQNLVSSPTQVLGIGRNISSELQNEDLSDDDMTMDTLSSRIKSLESCVESIKNFDEDLDGRIASSLDNYFEQRSRGTTSPGLGKSSTNNRSNTPDLLDGEGVGR